MRPLPQELQEQNYAPPLEPHTVLPAQFFTAQERRRARNSAERLMYAILEDAVSVFCKHREPSNSKRRRVYRNAKRWFESDDRTWLFSFLRICETLDLDAERIRNGLALRRGQIVDEMPAAGPVSNAAA